MPLYTLAGFVSAVFILYLLSFCKDPKKTKLSVKHSYTAFKKLTPYLIIGLILAAIVDVYSPKGLVTEILGDQTGIYGVVLGIAIGFLTPGPRYLVYPLASVLALNGAGIGAITALVCADEMIRPETIFLEIKTLGKRFFFYRFSLSFFLSVVAGITAIAVGSRVMLLTITETLAVYFNPFPYIEVAFLFFVGLGVAGMISVWVSRDIVEKEVGRKSGLRGIVLATFIGIITPGPLTTIYPIVDALKRKGITKENLVSYMTGQTLMGPLRVPLEISLLGLPFFIFRLCMAIVLPIMGGIVSTIVCLREWA